MKKVLMRHPTMRFNFTPPGEPFETNEDDVQYLIDTYGCELVSADVEPKAPAPEPVPEPEPEPVLEQQPEEPIYRGAGWYEWRGDKYRKADLPDEAAALLE
jgi:hypothetical protein